jgi:hypothetical protein
MGILDVIDRGLSESQQNIINLTEPDYDVYPLPVSMDTTVKVAIDIEIQSQAMAGDTMIWGHPTKGIWGENKWGSNTEVGFILGHPKYGILGSSKLGTAASDWVTEQEYVNI